MNPSPSDRSGVRFQIALAALVWSCWLAALGWQEAWSVLRAHWPISLTMIFGSMVAGGTCEGGGAVAFPVFTKILRIGPEDARMFSLAIQSVGMTCASLVIVYRRGRFLDWRVINLVSVAGAAGLIAGGSFVAPAMAPIFVKFSFTVFFSSFAVVLVWIHRRKRIGLSRVERLGGREKAILLFTGFVGGILSSIIGTGVGIACFSLLVVLFRFDERAANPMSVILMAIDSLVGFAFYGLKGGFTPEVREWWLAAVPVVVIGAPLGAMLMATFSRRAVIGVLVSIILVELVSTLVILPITGTMLLWGSATALVVIYFYYQLDRYGSYIEQAN